MASEYIDKRTEESGNITYIYDEKHIKKRNKRKEVKVNRLEKSISDLRTKVREDLKSNDVKVVLTALAVGLIDDTYERVGNEESAEGGHFGVTTWKVKHITFSGNTAKIKYVGKSGVKQDKEVKQKSLVTTLKALVKDKKKNDRVFETDDFKLSANDVNKYLKKFKITAKDIRGFHANTEMRKALKSARKGKLPKDEKEKTKKLKEEFKKALEETAKKVGHEPGTLKNQYLIHSIEENYMSGKTASFEFRLSKRAEIEEDQEENLDNVTDEEEEYWDSFRKEIEEENEFNPKRKRSDMTLDEIEMMSEMDSEEREEWIKRFFKDGSFFLSNRVRRAEKIKIDPGKNWKDKSDFVYFLPKQDKQPPGFLEKYDDEDRKDKNYRWVNAGNFKDSGELVISRYETNSFKEVMERNGFFINEGIFGDNLFSIPKFIKDKYNRYIKLGRAIEKALRMEKIDVNVTILKEMLKLNQNAIKSTGWDLIISAEPSDLRTISTNRGWTSCMNLKGGQFAHTLENIIAARDLVAYAVNKKGKWLARVILRYDGKGKWWPESKVYGQPSSISLNDFKDKVIEWLKSNDILGEEGNFSEYFNSYSDFQHFSEDYNSRKFVDKIDEFGSYKLFYYKADMEKVRMAFKYNYGNVEIINNLVIEVSIFNDVDKSRINKMIKLFPPDEIEVKSNIKYIDKIYHAIDNDNVEALEKYFLPKYFSDFDFFDKVLLRALYYEKFDVARFLLRNKNISYTSLRILARNKKFNSLEFYLGVFNNNLIQFNHVIEIMAQEGVLSEVFPRLIKNISKDDLNKLIKFSINNGFFNDIISNISYEDIGMANIYSILDHINRFGTIRGLIVSMYNKFPQITMRYMFKNTHRFGDPIYFERFLSYIDLSQSELNKIFRKEFFASDIDYGMIISVLPAFVSHGLDVDAFISFIEKTNRKGMNIDSLKQKLEAFYSCPKITRKQKDRISNIFKEQKTAFLLSVRAGQIYYTDNKLEYSVDMLIEIAANNKTEEIPIDYLEWNMKEEIWDKNTSPNDVLENPSKYKDDDKRIEEAELKYPILIYKGEVIDGYHRLAKAIKQNKKTIKAKVVTDRQMDAARIDKKRIEELSKKAQDFQPKAPGAQILIEPYDSAVAQALAKLPPHIKNNITKIVVHPEGGPGQLGHVEMGPGKDPREVHIFKARINEQVRRMFGTTQPTPVQLEQATQMALVETLTHEGVHIGPEKTQEQILHPGNRFRDESGTEMETKRHMRSLFPNVASVASLKLDDIRNKYFPFEPMTEPDLEFAVYCALDKKYDIVKKGISLIKDPIIRPAILEIQNAIEFNKQAIGNKNVGRLIGLLNSTCISEHEVFELACWQFENKIRPTGKLDEQTMLKLGEMSIEDLPRNFGTVVPGKLYRGGMIDNIEQLRVLRDNFGVKRIVSLHNDPEIGRMCTDLGLEHLPAPIEIGSQEEYGRKILGPRVSNLLIEKPTYIHCWFGADRTGGVIARFRTETGWTNRDAYLEAKAYGFKDIFADLIDWFSEIGKGPVPVDTKQIRRMLRKLKFNPNLPYKNPEI